MDVRAEKEGEFIELFDVYGELLTENQKEVCRSYLEYDLSLGEIAEDKGVSRQSVSDCLKKSCRRLKEFEEILGDRFEKRDRGTKQKVRRSAFRGGRSGKRSGKPFLFRRGKRRSVCNASGRACRSETDHGNERKLITKSLPQKRNAAGGRNIFA